MRFKFFNIKKKKIIKLSIDEVEQRVMEEIKKNEKLAESYVDNYSDKLNSLVDELVRELNRFDPLSLHPRLTGTAKNFKSSMLKLWNKNLDYEGIKKNIEKMALFKFKHHRILFSVKPEEIERINEIIGEIASTISSIERKKNSFSIDNLNNVISEINRIRELDANIAKLEENKRELIKKIENYKNNSKETNKIELEIQKVRREIENLKLEISKRENRAKKLVAIVRKAVKSFAHNAGLKVDFDDFDELQSISKKVAIEVKKGNVKVKNTQINKILSSLDKIKEGELIREMAEIDILKKDLADKKLKLQKLRAKLPRFDTDIMEREIENIDDKIKRLTEERGKIKTLLETKLSKTFGSEVIIT